MLKRARHRKATRRNPHKSWGPETWPKIQGQTFSPHAWDRLAQRVANSNNPTLVEMFTLAGYIISHSCQFRKAKKGRYIVSGGGYSRVISREQKKALEVIVTLMQDDSR